MADLAPHQAGLDDQAEQQQGDEDQAETVGEKRAGVCGHAAGVEGERFRRGRTDRWGAARGLASVSVLARVLARAG
ncbi:hypothetical protein MASR2M16_22890 [Thauera terpenica]